MTATMEMTAMIQITMLSTTTAHYHSNGNDDGRSLDFDGDYANNYDIDISSCLGQRQQRRPQQWR